MLTETEVYMAIPSKRPYKLADAGGMFLMVTPSGGKLWRLKYRIDGKEKQLSIGSASSITIEEARVKGASAKKLLSEGIDPSYMKKEMKEARADAVLSKTYKLTAKDKAIADYIVDQMAARFGLTAGPF